VVSQLAMEWEDDEDNEWTGHVTTYMKGRLHESDFIVWKMSCDKAKNPLPKS
jgi:hypothetical protein